MFYIIIFTRVLNQNSIEYAIHRNHTYTIVLIYLSIFIRVFVPIKDKSYNLL